MNHHEYRQIDAINWSSLKHMAESPLLYRHVCDNGKEDTKALAVGRYTHTMVFEPKSVAEHYAIFDGPRRAGNEWKQFAASNEGKTVLRKDEAEAPEAMAQSVRRHPLVLPYLNVPGQFEQPVVWTDMRTGLKCKARPDWIIPRDRVLIDLKTCVSIDGRRFGAAAARYGYHCQLAHYAAGITTGLGWTPARILLVAVEKTAPYDVGVFEIDADTLYYADEEVGALLERVATCTESGHWPGRYTEEQALQLPAWVGMDDETEDADALGLTIGE